MQFTKEREKLQRWLIERSGTVPVPLDSDDQEISTAMSSLNSFVQIKCLSFQIHYHLYSVFRLNIIFTNRTLL
jgi:hypothetical protein